MKDLDDLGIKFIEFREETALYQEKVDLLHNIRIAGEDSVEEDE